MGNIALMPEGDVLHRGNSIAADETGHTGHALAGDRVALMRHCRGTLLSRAEIFLSLADIRTLQVADFRGELLKGARYNRQGRHVLCMAVTLDDLRSER